VPDCPAVSRLEYYVHDYLEFQPSKEDVEKRARERAESGKKGAASRWAKGKSPAPMADPMATPIGDDVLSSPVLNREGSGMDDEESLEEVNARLAERVYGVDWTKVRNESGWRKCMTGRTSRSSPTVLNPELAVLRAGGGGVIPQHVGSEVVVPGGEHHRGNPACMTVAAQRAHKPIKSPTGVVLAGGLHLSSLDERLGGLVAERRRY
jgi:hypothetical protein